LSYISYYGKGGDNKHFGNFNTIITKILNNELIEKFTRLEKLEILRE